MFGIGFWETIVIILIILIVIKPDDLPKFFHKMGKIIGEIRHSYDIFMDTIRNLDEEIKKPMDENIKEVKEYKPTKKRKKS